MTMTKKWIAVFLLIGSAIYALSPGPSHLLDNPTGWELREQLVFLSGTLSLSLMVLTMLASSRWAVINRAVGGLDKAYLLHKTSGIYCFILALLHWLMEKMPAWLIAANLLDHPGDLSNGAEFTEWQILLFKSGALIAEIMFYVFAALIFIALLKQVPYRFFRLIHKIFAPLFLLFAYHAATAQLKEHWLSSVGGYLLLILIAIGCISAIMSLLSQIGRSAKSLAQITAVKTHGGDIIEITLRTANAITYRAGQYVFLTFSHDGEPHPFTIASDADDRHQLRFIIKNLGDFTGSLKNAVATGQSVTIEGPYGEFKFDDNAQHQIWIAGGIGITPFLARLEHLIKHGGSRKPVDFWYCTQGKLNDQFPDGLAELCLRCGIRLHHLDAEQGQYLTEAHLMSGNDSLTNVSIWFCGPRQFRDHLENILARLPFDNRNLHFDSFDMR